MEDIIPFLIFVVFAAIAWIANKFNELKAQSEQRRQPPAESEDLPERTRQMLYGGEVKTATPKQATPGYPPQQRAPQPVQERPIAPPRPVAAPERPAAPRPVQRQPQAPAPRRTVVAGPPPAPTRQRGEELSPRMLQQRAQQQAMARVQPAGEELSPKQLKELREREERAQHQKRLLEQPASRRGTLGQRPEPRRQRSARPAATRAARGFLQTSDDVRRGIVLAEVLGPPKSLR